MLPNEKKIEKVAECSTYFQESDVFVNLIHRHLVSQISQGQFWGNVGLFSRYSRDDVLSFGGRLLSSWGGEILVAKYAPLLKRVESDCLERDLKFWIDAFLEQGRLQKADMLYVLPPHYIFLKQEGLKFFFDRIFSDKGFLIKKKYSIVLDLAPFKNQNREAVALTWEKLKSEARRKVRRGLESRFDIETLSEKNISVYLKEKGFLLNGLMAINMREKIRGTASNFDIFQVSLDKKPLAWQMVNWGKDVAILAGNCVSDYARENRLYGNHVLQWYVIQEAIRRGVRWIDWVGADPEPKTQKQKNITEFKLLWGGEIVTYNTYEYRFKNWRNSLFDFLKGCKDWKNRRFGGE